MKSNVLSLVVALAVVSLRESSAMERAMPPDLQQQGNIEHHVIDIGRDEDSAGADDGNRAGGAGSQDVRIDILADKVDPDMIQPTSGTTSRGRRFGPFVKQLNNILGLLGLGPEVPTSVNIGNVGEPGTASREHTQHVRGDSTASPPDLFSTTRRQEPGAPAREPRVSPNTVAGLQLQPWPSIGEQM